MSPLKESVEASVAAAASKVTGAGSAVTFVGWLTSSSFGMWAGIVIGLAGYFTSLYFKHQSNKRAKEAHEAYLYKLRCGSKAFPFGAFEVDE